MITLKKSVDAPFGTGTVVLPRVNLLPPEIAEQARFRRVQGGLGLAVVAAVGVVGLLYTGAAGSVSDAQNTLDTANSQQAALARQTAQYHDVTSVYARTAAAQQMLVQAMGPEVRYSRFLNDLSLSIPEHVWLTDVTFNQQVAAAAAAGTAPAGGLGTVTLNGVAYDHDDVAVWLESLATQKGYANPSLQNATESLIGSRRVVNWSTTVTLTPDALSGRYVKVGG